MSLQKLAKWKNHFACSLPFTAIYLVNLVNESTQFSSVALCTHSDQSSPSLFSPCGLALLILVPGKNYCYVNWCRTTEPAKRKSSLISYTSHYSRNHVSINQLGEGVLSAQWFSEGSDSVSTCIKQFVYRFYYCQQYYAGTALQW